MDLGATPLADRCGSCSCRRCGRRSSPPACSSSRSPSTTSCSRSSPPARTLQPLPVRIWSAIRFGVSPTINAIGTLMMVDLADRDRARGADPAAVRAPRERHQGPDRTGRAMGGCKTPTGAGEAIRHRGRDASASASQPPSTTSTSRSSRASSSRCSARRAAARRRRCGCSPDSRSRPRAGSCSRASRSRTCRPTSATSTWSSRATRCSTTSTSPTTSPSGSSARKVAKDEIAARVGEALELVSLDRARERARRRALRRPAPAGRARPRARQPARRCCCSTSRSARST